MITQNTVFGASRKKLGGVVAYRMNGQNIVRSKALQVENPQTPAQMVQRGKLKFLVEVWSIVASLADIGFRERLQKLSSYNRFVSLNLLNGFLTDGTAPTYEPTADNSLMVISKGSLENTPVLSAVADVSDLEVRVTYPTSLTYNQSSTDKCNVLVINRNNSNTLAFSEIANRSAGQADCTIPSGFMSAGHQLDIYVFFSSADGKASDNTHNLVTAIA